MFKKLSLYIVFVCGFAQSQTSKPRLLFKYPTRERVKEFFYCLDTYYDLMSEKFPFNFLITCDEDDKSMNNEVVKERLKKYKNLKIYFGPGISKIDACNRDMDKAPPYDILILVSDDMIPLKQNYDEIIVSEMLKAFPDFDGVLNFNGTVNGGNLNTLAILGKNYYQRFNYIYQPDYKSFYCDLEMTIVSKVLNKEAVVYNLIIEHRNPACGKMKKDKLYRKNYKYLKNDKRLFMQRLRKRFGLAKFSSSQKRMIARLIKE